jgi:hypothetical protein
VSLAILLASPAVVLAGDKAKGTVAVVEEESVQIKGADGKTYEIDIAEVIAEDLETGDMVEYDIVSGKPVHVKKAKK